MAIALRKRQDKLAKQRAAAERGAVEQRQEGPLGGVSSSAHKRMSAVGAPSPTNPPARRSIGGSAVKLTPPPLPAELGLDPYATRHKMAGGVHKSSLKRENSSSSASLPSSSSDVHVQRGGGADTNALSPPKGSPIQRRMSANVMYEGVAFNSAASPASRKSSSRKSSPAGGLSLEVGGSSSSSVARKLHPAASMPVDGSFREFFQKPPAPPSKEEPAVVRGLGDRRSSNFFQNLMDSIGKATPIGPRDTPPQSNDLDHHDQLNKLLLEQSIGQQQDSRSSSHEGTGQKQSDTPGSHWARKVRQAAHSSGGGTHDSTGLSSGGAGGAGRPKPNLARAGQQYVLRGLGSLGGGGAIGAAFGGGPRGGPGADELVPRITNPGLVFDESTLYQSKSNEGARTTSTRPSVAGRRCSMQDIMMGGPSSIPPQPETTEDILKRIASKERHFRERLSPRGDHDGGPLLDVYPSPMVHAEFLPTSALHSRLDDHSRPDSSSSSTYDERSKMIAASVAGLSGGPSPLSPLGLSLRDLQANDRYGLPVLRPPSAPLRNNSLLRDPPFGEHLFSAVSPGGPSSGVGVYASDDDAHMNMEQLLSNLQRKKDDINRILAFGPGGDPFKSGGEQREPTTDVMYQSLSSLERDNNRYAPVSSPGSPSSPASPGKGKYGKKGMFFSKGKKGAPVVKGKSSIGGGKGGIKSGYVVRINMLSVGTELDVGNGTRGTVYFPHTRGTECLCLDGGGGCVVMSRRVGTGIGAMGE